MSKFTDLSFLQKKEVILIWQCDYKFSSGSPTTILKHVAQGGPSAKTKEIWEEIVNT